jgi:hypothetical protein
MSSLPGMSRRPPRHELRPLAAGGTGAGAPIIHLLNRRRFVRVDWAPMKYLKLTLKTNRRRLRLEQWLLLALRTLAVLALVLAVARPVGSGTNLAGFLHVQGRASRIIVIDDSLSMGARTNGQPAFERAKNVVLQILDALGEQDSLTVVRSSETDAPMVRHAQPDATQVARLRESISQLTVRHSASNWPSILDAVDAHLQTAVYPIRDVCQTDPGRPAERESAVLGTRWETEETTVRIFDVGRRSRRGPSSPNCRSRVRCAGQYARQLHGDDSQCGAEPHRSRRF